MLDAGASITNCLNILSNEIPNKKLRGILSKIEDDVKKGELLLESMAKHNKVFPQLLISMVESGEVSGNIDEMMLRMSVHFEKENKINNKIKSAMTYPAILSVIAIAAVVGILENKVAEDAISKIRERVVRGDGLSSPIRENDIFPKMLSSMIKIGEESGTLDDILNKIADFYDDEVEQAIQTTTALIESLLIVVIGRIVISIMLPMFDMYTQM